MGTARLRVLVLRRSSLLFGVDGIPLSGCVSAVCGGVPRYIGEDESEIEGLGAVPMGAYTSKSNSSAEDRVTRYQAASFLFSQQLP